MDKRAEELCQKFAKHWSIDVLCNRENISYEDALDLLSSDEAIEYLDEQSAKLEKLYSRLPMYMVAQQIVYRMISADRATEAGPAITAFIKWFFTAPPPSNREFIKDLMKTLEVEQDG